MYPNCSRIDPLPAAGRKEARSELKLHADSPTTLNTVTAYGSGFI
jgi:hypothetical protein